MPSFSASTGSEGRFLAARMSHHSLNRALFVRGVPGVQSSLGRLVPSAALPLLHLLAASVLGVIGAPGRLLCGWFALTKASGSADPEALSSLGTSASSGVVGLACPPTRCLNAASNSRSPLSPSKVTARKPPGAFATRAMQLEGMFTAKGGNQVPLPRSEPRDSIEPMVGRARSSINPEPKVSRTRAQSLECKVTRKTDSSNIPSETLDYHTCKNMKMKQIPET